MDDIKNILSQVDEVLKQTKVENITAESPDKNLPLGYYLFEVVKADLGASKSKGEPQVCLQLKVVNDGYKEELDGEEVGFSVIKGTKNRNAWKYYQLTLERINRFISDMLKFEGDEPGQPLLEKDYFTNSELLSDALEVLVGRRIYGKVSEFKNQEGTTSTIINFITWKRAEQLELPIKD